MVAHSRSWTIHDLDTLPDDGGWTRYEIIDGELFVTCAPHLRHQVAASRLNTYLENWSQETGLGLTLQTPGVIFSPTDAVIPDLVWASQTCLSQGVDQAGHFILPPELIVEVLSPGSQHEKRDTEAKLNLYSTYGVQEYWIVSWQHQTLAVYRRSGSQLQFVSTLGSTDTLTSPLLPGFSTPLAKIFL